MQGSKLQGNFVTTGALIFSAHFSAGGLPLLYKRITYVSCKACPLLIGLVASLWPFLAPHPLFCGWCMGNPASMADPLP